MMEVLVWPDYSWENVEDYNETLDGWRSDDYVLVVIPSNMAVDDIETYLKFNKVQG